MNNEIMIRIDLRVLNNINLVVLYFFVWSLQDFSLNFSSLTPHSLWPATSLGCWRLLSLFIGIIALILTLTPTFIFIYINKDIKCFFKTFSSFFSYLHLNHNLKGSLATTRRSWCSGFPLILECIFVSLHLLISYFASLLMYSLCLNC